MASSQEFATDREAFEWWDLHRGKPSTDPRAYVPAWLFLERVRRGILAEEAIKPTGEFK